MRPFCVVESDVSGVVSREDHGAVGRVAGARELGRVVTKLTHHVTCVCVDQFETVTICCYKYLKVQSQIVGRF